MGLLKRYRTWKRRNRFLRKPTSARENIEADIRDVLIRVCPAFIYSNTGGGAIWHKCLCGDKPFQAEHLHPCNDEGRYDECTCVWHMTDTCHRGTWAELNFVKSQASKKEN
ncbi:MAG TPA: hypothetical protein HPP87_07220 [Planctomycetes bacterium]|nr:hypothetical protein [Planctomycetota bacterium]